ncbi:MULTISPECIES: thiocillin family RiPP [unclassified Streptomyces]|uniref:thiocillin family RiPP n=1 Tax=unclassified Streptomyces TaxID=2593676 RepID=UPI00332BE226
MDTNEDMFDLYALDGELSVEELPQGNALGCWFSAASASSASCPATSASSIGSASTFG